MNIRQRDNDILQALTKYSFKTKKPISAIFELTHICNFRCIHCYISKDIEKRCELSLNEVKKIIDQLSKIGIIFLTFTGGEIFTRKDFYHILEYAKKKKFIIRLKTNGSLITKQIAKKIAEANVLNVDVSLYGFNQKTYKNVTKNGQAFKKVIKSILLLKKFKAPVNIVFPLLKETVDQTKKVINFTKKYKLSYNQFYNITPMTCGCENPIKHACLDPKKILKTYKIYFESDKNKLKDFFSKTSKEIIKPDRVCNVGYTGLTISPYGDIYPCVDLRDSLGNLRHKKLIDIWTKSKKLKKIRNIRFQDFKKCQKCHIKNFCRICLAYSFKCSKQQKVYAEINKKIFELEKDGFNK